MIQKTTIMTSYPSIIRWWALSGVILVSFNLRTAVTSLSAIYNYIGHDIHGLNIAVLGTLPLLSFAAFGALTTVLVHRIGLEKSLIVSMALIMIGIVARACTSSFPIFAACSVIALSGIAFGNVLMLPMIKKFFSDHLGTITACYSVMVAVSAGVPSAIAMPIVDAFGWRVNVAIWAFPAAIAIIPWTIVSWFVTHRLAHLDHPTPGDVGLHPLGTERAHVAPFRWPVAWSIVILFGVGMMSMYAMLTWLPTYLVMRGLSRASAGNVLFVYNMIGIAHSLLVPMFIARMKHPFSIVVLAAILQLSGYAGFMLAPSASYLWAVIGGPGLMTVPASFALINLRTRTSEGSASLSTFVQGVGYMFAALGPFLFGKLFTITHQWSYSFLFLGVMSLIMLFGGWQAVQPRIMEDA